MYVRTCIRNRCVLGKHMNYNVTTLFQRARIHSSHLHYIHAYIHSYNFTSLWTVRRYGLCSMVCAGCSLSKYFNNMHKAYASDAHSKWSEIDSAHMYGVRACVHTSSPWSRNYQVCSVAAQYSTSSTEVFLGYSQPISTCMAISLWPLALWWGSIFKPWHVAPYIAVVTMSKFSFWSKNTFPIDFVLLDTVNNTTELNDE